ncbi:TetR family transcriptional regulator [Streptomyces sp. NPDC013953]|uniref:TetR family transcriptional regulator n=1 Tax=Streptomyces sp. NPDC013953 TaxID=3364868 RepID=UPI0036F54FA9
MSHTAGTGTGIRRAQKQKTRQALLDAALLLLEEQSLSSLGLREVTRAVGVAPAAFYRHFRDTADLGVALVDEALGSLHETLRTTLATTGDSGERIAAAIELIADLVHGYPAHVRFIVRERHGGVRRVREAIGGQLELFVREVADELARQPESRGWDRDDLLMLAGLYVDHMVMTASAFLAVGPDREARDGELGERAAQERAAQERAAQDRGEYERVARTARRQLRLVALGRRHWLD